MERNAVTMRRGLSITIAITIGLGGCATAVVSQAPLAPEAVEEETIVTTTEQTRRGPPVVPSYRYLVAMAQSADPAVRQRGYDSFRARVRAGGLTINEREALNRLFVPRGFGAVR